MPMNELDLTLMRDKAKEFPAVEDPRSYTSARIWHCAYRTLQPLRAFVNLRALAIAGYPDPSLDIVSGLIALESLEILHLPNVTSLSPLAELRSLRKLSLQTLPSWDASGRKIVVDSLAPIASLPKLEELELFGVLPESEGVSVLLYPKSPALRRVKVSQYPVRERDRLRERFPA